MVDTYTLKHKIRFVTATALFDGHDASINIMRRLLQQGGVEVIHLGHNRSVHDIVQAAVQEDAHAIAISSYQGGHIEFFKYLRERLNAEGRSDMKIFGGGGGVIVPEEIEELQKAGVTRIYSPEDGRKLGLLGIIQDMIKLSDYALAPLEILNEEITHNETLKLTRNLTLLENNKAAVNKALLEKVKSCANLDSQKKNKEAPFVLGVTGTGGAGKSSLTDEIIRRFLFTFKNKNICIFSVDPSKKKTGGALLGDRIRMNSISHPNIFMRSFATRESGTELAAVLGDAIGLARMAKFDLVIVETSGIGQGDTGILDVSDLSMYVMTSEYGASTQLEKIDMLDFADIVVINKFDRRGSEDAFRDVKAQIRRSRFQSKHMDESEFPVFGTIASKFNDDGVNAVFLRILELLNKQNNSKDWNHETKLLTSQKSSFVSPIIPQNRTNYLSEITETIRKYHSRTAEYVSTANNIFGIEKSLQLITSSSLKEELEKIEESQWEQIPSPLKVDLQTWNQTLENYRSPAFKYNVRGKQFQVPTYTTSLCGTQIPKVALPSVNGYGDIVKFIRSENFPGAFPYTAGVFPYKRDDEDPKRQFAGEGGPARTNKRFHYLSANDPAKRLSTAFDSVTLYGEDPDSRPDIYGKVGESGVSIATLDDMKVLFAGFDLCHPSTSVSMTINGPAPIILAFFMNAAVDQQIELAVEKNGRKALSPEVHNQIFKNTLSTVRGTVQADILKEDQAQNTCIFSTDFALKMMGDVQEFFIQNQVKNYYSVSISGYHIAEAGANPITQAAFTLANGFTYVEYYLSRGMNIDDFASNLSFFFSNGMDPEYSVIGRIARRIWAIAMRDKYSANERSQKLKYHIQTSGRSLHAQEIDFNDIRTTLQALLAINDNCNSLHTNAYDEAITTPTEESVRRSMAIQIILNREFGPAKCENINQGSYFIETLTELVENSILEEFDRISSRGGVLGAMETQYQRGKIQEESLFYETKKDSGELPIVGVNTFINPRQDEISSGMKLELARASYEEKDAQLKRLQEFQANSQDRTKDALLQLQQVALKNGNVFAELLHTTRYASLGQITHALYQVGGQYRRAL